LLLPTGAPILTYHAEALLNNATSASVQLKTEAEIQVFREEIYEGEQGLGLASMHC
jgi:hypothetical protein